MEAVLDTYQREVEPGEVRLCLDERPCQLLDEVREPLPMKEGKARREDSEYVRMGTCNVFLAYDMDKGERYCQTTARRTKVDFADFLDMLLSEKYPEASKITIVLDNLNIHGYGSFFAALPEERAMELREKISFCFTPKHGSWLNMAEIEFSAMSRQCLGKRIGSMDKMKRIINTWQQHRNMRKVKICWSFTSDDAHETFKKFYPIVEFED